MYFLRFSSMAAPIPPINSFKPVLQRVYGWRHRRFVHIFYRCVTPKPHMNNEAISDQPLLNLRRAQESFIPGVAGVMMLKIQLWSHFLVILNCNNILALLLFLLYFWAYKCSLGGNKRLSNTSNIFLSFLIHSLVVVVKVKAVSHFMCLLRFAWAFPGDILCFLSHLQLLLTYIRTEMLSGS